MVQSRVQKLYRSSVMAARSRGATVTGFTLGNLAGSNIPIRTSSLLPALPT